MQRNVSKTDFAFSSPRRLLENLRSFFSVGRRSRLFGRFEPLDVFLLVPKSQRDRCSMIGFVMVLNDVFAVTDLVFPPAASAREAMPTGEEIVEKFSIRFAHRRRCRRVVQIVFDRLREIVYVDFFHIIVRDDQRCSIGTGHLTTRRKWSEEHVRRKKLLR